VFALEIASHTTYKRDLRAKPARFAELGVAEYWRLDPTGGEYFTPPLQGEHRRDRVGSPTNGVVADVVAFTHIVPQDLRTSAISAFAAPQDGVDELLHAARLLATPFALIEASTGGLDLYAISSTGEPARGSKARSGSPFRTTSSPRRRPGWPSSRSPRGSSLTSTG